MEHEFRAEFVDAENDRGRALYGELNRPNGRDFKCGKCGFRADKHLVASWNLARKRPMRYRTVGGEGPNEPLIIRVMGGMNVCESHNNRFIP